MADSSAQDHEPGQGEEEEGRQALADPAGQQEPRCQSQVAWCRQEVLFAGRAAVHAGLSVDPGAPRAATLQTKNVATSSRIAGGPDRGGARESPSRPRRPGAQVRRRPGTQHVLRFGPQRPDGQELRIGRELPPSDHFRSPAPRTITTHIAPSERSPAPFLSASADAECPPRATSSGWYMQQVAMIDARNRPSKAVQRNASPEDW